MIAPKALLKPLARAGYASRGVVYFIIGLFATLGVAGSGGDKKSPTDAIGSLLDQPFGAILVWPLVVGLIGFAIWRSLQSILNTDRHGLDPKGLTVRAGLLCSAAAYGYLAAYALGLLGVLTAGGDAGGRSAILSWTSAAISDAWTKAALSAIFAGVGAAHIWKAATRKYADHFDAPDTAMPLVHAVSVIGLSARGTVFLILAVLSGAQVHGSQPQSGDKPGIEDALAYVENLPGGRWLLLAMGVGVLLFAAYSFAEARWRRINVDDA